MPENNILQMPSPKKQKPSKASEEKYGKEVMNIGFSVVPSLLLKAQRRLGLNTQQLTILMHLMDFWWDASRKPYPSKATLSERINLSERQIQRHIAEMEQAGLVKRIERKAKHKGKLSNYYDLSGLVAKLQELAPEFQKVEDEVKAKRKAVEMPRGFNVPKG